MVRGRIYLASLLGVLLGWTSSGRARHLTLRQRSHHHACVRAKFSVRSRLFQTVRAAAASIDSKLHSAVNLWGPPGCM
jgi:hypothetical protein